MIYILSTMTNSVLYRTYRMIGGDSSQGPLPVPEPGAILIHGGAGLPSLKSGIGEVSKDIEGNPLWTPRGVVTAVTEEQYERLQKHWLFQRHVKENYIKVVEKDISHNTDAIALEVEKTMQPHDEFSQLSKETIQQRIKVKTPDTSVSQEASPLDVYR